MFTSFYILAGKLSITSQSGDGIDMLGSIGGLVFQGRSVRVMQINACLYASKGIVHSSISYKSFRNVKKNQADYVILKFK
jgi:hypothetical protein